MSKEQPVPESAMIKIAALEQMNTQLAAKNESLSAANVQLTTRLEGVEQYQRAQQEQSIVSNRRVRLESLARSGYELDVENEVERYSKLPEELFVARLGDIEKYHRKSPVNAGWIPTVNHGGVQPWQAAGNPDELTAEDIRTQAVENYAKKSPDECKIRPGETPQTHGVRIVEQFLAKKKAARNGQ